MIYANTPDEKAQEHTDDQSGSSSDYRSHRARLRSSHRCHPASLGGRLRGYSASLGGRLGGHLASLGGRLYCLGCLQVVHILSELLHVCSHISFHFVLSEFLHVCTYIALSPAVEFSHRLTRSCSRAISVPSPHQGKRHADQSKCLERVNRFRSLKINMLTFMLCPRNL